MSMSFFVLHAYLCVRSAAGRVVYLHAVGDEVMYVLGVGKWIR